MKQVTKKEETEVSGGAVPTQPVIKTWPSPGGTFPTDPCNPMPDPLGDNENSTIR